MIATTLLHAIAGVAWTTVALGLAAGIVPGPKARLLKARLATDPEKLRRLIQALLARPPVTRRLTCQKETSPGGADDITLEIRGDDNLIADIPNSVIGADHTIPERMAS